MIARCLFRLRVLLAGSVLASAGTVLPAAAEEPATPPSFQSKGFEADYTKARKIALRRDVKRSEYESLARRLAESAARRATLAAEIAALGDDARAIGAALIEAAKAERKLTEDIADIESRLTGLRERQSGIRTSLTARRALLAEVLASLQRMGLNPPPALLVTPDDALSAVRSAILLGAVVPELREETTALLRDLSDLRNVTARITDQKKELAGAQQEQAAERERLSLLLDAKNAARQKSQAEIDAEQARASKLAEEASSLAELIDTLEEDRRKAEEAARLEAQKKADDAAEAARLAALEAKRKRTEEAEAKARAAKELADRLARLRDPDEKDVDHRLSASLPFSSRKGRLVLPVAGQFDSRYGDTDETGEKRLGDTVRTQSGSIVTAPAGGTVLFAGRFRSFGQTIILDAGEGYSIVMGGMHAINVTRGQAVLAGEPVGEMGDTRLAALAPLEDTLSEPALYVEFWKDKKPVNPAAWWSDRSFERTDDDS
ncbi:murein hydrolase activator EnvC [Notoacmeibacter sp. MSK16QG-6]|uniref:murein hydrolase activator EnvC family protein n=1 Tax=Notoacmeibacter sp. MSK16QG-6 TaxID=2957982 RepID=UPI0020A007F6|nr:peptidoglycan DD-metalloendopeptidase family protein [Notoacmeibacter sp. MSK16QG-6]MCP1200956.1 peptidoglycan DD-metalloendopeptidase family protein [Notoacmeibacter sp. MSK16QG-6]